MKTASQCERVLAVLEDGRPHTIEEIHERAGTMRLNSRVAELRKRLKASAETIVCSHQGGAYSYQLVPLSSPEEIERLGPDGSSGDLSGVGNPDTGSANPLKQPASLESSEGDCRGGDDPVTSWGDSPPPGVADQLSIFEAAA